jgi:hypothetical protein
VEVAVTADAPGDHPALQQPAEPVDRLGKAPLERLDPRVRRLVQVRSITLQIACKSADRAAGGLVAGAQHEGRERLWRQLRTGVSVGQCSVQLRRAPPHPVCEIQVRPDELDRLAGRLFGGELEQRGCRQR